MIYNAVVRNWCYELKNNVNFIRAALHIFSSRRSCAARNVNVWQKLRLYYYHALRTSDQLPRIQPQSETVYYAV